MSRRLYAIKRILLLLKYLLGSDQTTRSHAHNINTAWQMVNGYWCMGYWCRCVHQLPNTVENTNRFDAFGTFDGQNAARY